MNTVHKILEDALDGILSELEEPISEEQLTSLCERALNSTLSRISDDVLGTLKESATEVLSEARSASEQFTIRNIERWSRGFDLLEMLIAIGDAPRIVKTVRGPVHLRNHLVFVNC